MSTATFANLNELPSNSRMNQIHGESCRDFSHHQMSHFNCQMILEHESEFGCSSSTYMFEELNQNELFYQDFYINITKIIRKFICILSLLCLIIIGIYIYC